MRSPRGATLFGLWMAALGCQYACENDRPPSFQPSPSAVPDGSVVSLTIAGPGDVAPGESVQLTVQGRMTDGTTRNVTSLATWSIGSTFCASCPTDDGVILFVPTAGMVSAVEMGEGLVSVRLAGAETTKELIAVPPGTFRLSGRVTTDAQDPQPVAGASVTATGATASWNTVTTNDGAYRIYGVAGRVMLEVDAEGYVSKSTPLVVNRHLAVEVALESLGDGWWDY